VHSLLKIAFQPRHFLLPLAMVAICAPGIGFLGSSWVTIRWFILAVLALYTVFFSASRIRSSVPAFTIAVVFYLAWCTLTYSWSKVPDLSLLKIAALVMVVFACFRGGYQWVAEHEAASSLDFLWPWTIVALMAWISGTAESSIQIGENMSITSGATGNPNFLGFIMSTSTPVVFFYTYKNWESIRSRVLWLALLALCIAGLYQAGSRASYLVFVSVSCGLLAAQGVGRVVIVPVVIAVIAGIVSAMAPYFSDQFVARNIYKDPESGDIFYTREEPWEQSYEAAVEGGLLGLGYGVTYNDYEFEASATAVNYGREKGNTQLAVVEETGIVGLVLYCTVIGTLFWEMLLAFWVLEDREIRTLLGIVIGTLFGLTMHSLFEAWWVAPGAVEFGFFWAMAGVGCALARAVTQTGMSGAAEHLASTTIEKA
jgi:O-antigen ligase